MVNPRIKRQCCEGKVQAVAIHWWGIIFVLQHTDHLIHGRQLLVQGFHERLEVRDHLGGCIDQSLSKMCQASGKLEHAGEYIYIYMHIYKYICSPLCFLFHLRHLRMVYFTYTQIKPGHLLPQLLRCGLCLGAVLCTIIVNIFGSLWSSCRHLVLRRSPKQDVPDLYSLVLNI